MMARRLLKIVLAALLTCVVAYAAIAAVLYAAMSQTPERFGAFMSHVPGPAMMVLPFRPLWMSARAGTLHVGDAAPDFTLPPLHGEGAVTLSQEYRTRPVVLVFGSYT